MNKKSFIGGIFDHFSIHDGHKALLTAGINGSESFTIGLISEYASNKDVPQYYNAYLESLEKRQQDLQDFVDSFYSCNVCGWIILSIV